MISENDYKLGLFNGDIGLIWRNEAGHLMAVFEQVLDQVLDQKLGQASGTKTNTETEDKANVPSYKCIMPSRLPNYTPVYAMTIHKTQGSEFDHVTMVLPTQSDNRLLSKELLYTGITRAKSLLSIASHQGVWLSGVKREVKRHSGLKIGC
jgi:exodeoxyribonuclease V alpha subunit